MTGYFAGLKKGLRVTHRSATTSALRALGVNLTALPNFRLASLRTDAFRWGKLNGAWFRAAVSLGLGALVLLDAGLYSRASSRQPSGGSIGAIVGSCIEGNRRAWGSLMNSVDDDFE